MELLKCGQCGDRPALRLIFDVKWTIEEYDGSEWVAEEHRTWH